MNNLIIAALTFVLLPAFGKNTNTKTLKNCQMKNEIVVDKMNFNSEVSDNMDNEIETKTTSVAVDYIIDENGKAYITYISSENMDAKNEVVKFIESVTYNFNKVPGKVYSMTLSMNK